MYARAYSVRQIKYISVYSRWQWSPASQGESKTALSRAEKGIETC